MTGHTSVFRQKEIEVEDNAKVYGLYVYGLFKNWEHQESH